MTEHKTGGTNPTGVTDSLEVEVKGPGKQWAWRDEQEEARRAAQGEEYEDLKGPGPEWETNEEGEYINREDDE